MINGILQLVPIVVLAALSAYFSYQMDKRFSYVEKINKRFGFNENKSMVFFIGIMMASMVIIPLVLLKLMGMTKETAYILTSVMVGFCCYSSMDYLGLQKRTSK